MAAPLSLVQAAERLGITKQGVSDAFKRGRIPRRDDGLYEVADIEAFAETRRAVRGGLTRARPGGVKASRPQALDVSVDGDAAARSRAAYEATLGTGGLFTTRADAELARDTFAAHSRRLEYEERSGRLVETDKVNRAIAGACGKVRSRLLAVPAEWAPALARCKGPAEVEDMLREAITAALEALAEDFGEDD